MRRLAALLVATSLFTGGAAFAADGARLFALQCKSCHAPKSGLMGPSLQGVAGASIASRKDFKYSPALAAKGGVWSDAALDAFLARPAGFAPGSRMSTAVASAENRAALIAHLKTLK
jgi:cytochrome c